jgi:hypothetical protein
VTYLGMRIETRTNGTLRLSVFDKQEKLGFMMIRYPCKLSNVPRQQPMGVYIGQLIRYALICNNQEDFKRATRMLTIRMVNRGHKVTEIAKAFRKYITNRWEANDIKATGVRAWFKQVLIWVSNLTPREVQQEVESYKAKKSTPATPANIGSTASGAEPQQAQPISPPPQPAMTLPKPTGKAKPKPKPVAPNRQNRPPPTPSPSPPTIPGNAGSSQTPLPTPSPPSNPGVTSHVETSQPQPQPQPPPPPVVISLTESSTNTTTFIKSRS